MDAELLSGSNDRLDVPRAIALLLRRGLQDRYALVAALDSTPDVARLSSLVPWLQAAGAWHRKLSTDVVIEVAVVSHLVESGILNGFDELWLFSARPTVARPMDVRIASDRPIDAEQAGLGEWMRASGCTAGLGDGDGLNYVTVDRQVAKALHPIA